MKKREITEGIELPNQNRIKIHGKGKNAYTWKYWIKDHYISRNEKKNEKEEWNRLDVRENLSNQISPAGILS